MRPVRPARLEQRRIAEPRRLSTRAARRQAAEHGLMSVAADSVEPAEGVVLFLVARNEELRLPFFLDHYSRLGVKQIVAVDHRSTDATPDILDAHPGVVRYRTEQPFEMKAAWLDVLLRRHGVGRWCLVVDADEILRYPRDHEVRLPELCAYMDSAGETALQCLLLDMYGSASFDELAYEPGADPIETCPFFDRGPYSPSREWEPDDLLLDDGLLDSACYGGVRARAFGMTRVCISKYPLFRFGPLMYAGTGCHFVEGVSPSALRASLLHFKFLQDFPERVDAAVFEGQYAGQSADYHHYAATLAHEDSVAFDPAVSTRFEGTDQLIKSGIMRETPEFGRWIRDR